MKRRDFLSGMALAAAAAAAAGCTGGTSTFTSTGGGGSPSPARPNILFLIGEEIRLPPAGYGANEGENPDFRELLSFAATLSPDNAFAPLFPALVRLRQNAVVLRTHYIASAACCPSRTSMLTGQYPTVHGVSQTPGMFKDPSDPGWVFLDPAGVPTLGDWFQAAGYETYYYGKWHVSESCDDLGDWGFPFNVWDGPEPHGSNVSSLGVYRDVSFANDVVSFLKTKGAQQKTDPSPWLCCAGFANPHDISNWPVPWFLPAQAGVQQLPGPLPATVPDTPDVGDMSNPAPGGPPPTDCPAPALAAVPLNPDGFPTDAYGPPPTINEDLSTKPSCHYEASIKVGCGLKSLLLGGNALSPYPMQLQGANSNAWSVAYGQWWMYLQYLMDQQMKRVLDALDENGLADDTIVIFTTDHGDYCGAHNQMVQKWHTAYEETSRVPFVISSPLINPGNEILEVDQPSSHIDVVPTLLGLLGYSGAAVQALGASITGHTVMDLVGSDLSQHVLNPASDEPILGPDGEPRPGVLFMTDDEITQMTSPNPNNAQFPQFQLYNQIVADIRNTVDPPLTLGPIVQPNLLRCLITGDWKYTRYYDPNGVEADQFELYHLPSDPNETLNLVDFRTNQIRDGVSVPGLTEEQLTAQKDLLTAQLAVQEQLLL